MPRIFLKQTMPVPPHNRSTSPLLATGCRSVVSMMSPTLIVGPNDKDRYCMVPPSLTIEGATADRTGPLRWRAAAPDFAAHFDAISRSCSKQCSAGQAFINAMWQHLGESQAEATGPAELRNSAVAWKVNGADNRQ